MGYISIRDWLQDQKTISHLVKQYTRITFRVFFPLYLKEKRCMVSLNIFNRKNDMGYRFWTMGFINCISQKFRKEGEKKNQKHSYSPWRCSLLTTCSASWPCSCTTSHFRSSSASLMLERKNKIIIRHTRSSTYCGSFTWELVTVTLQCSSWSKFKEKLLKQ